MAVAWAECTSRSVRSNRSDRSIRSDRSDRSGPAAEMRAGLSHLWVSEELFSSLSAHPFWRAAPTVRPRLSHRRCQRLFPHRRRSQRHHSSSLAASSIWTLRGRLASTSVAILDGPDAGRTVITDSSGSFEIGDLRFAGFAVRFRHEGYDSAFRAVTLVSDTSLAIAMRPAMGRSRGPDR